MTSFASRPSMPTTPRSPAVGASTPRSRRATLNASTSLYNNPPTPSRAMAMAFAPLPPLLTRAYKEVHYTDDDDSFLPQLELDALEIEEAIARLGQAISERKRDLAATVAELEDQKRSSEADIRALIEKAKDVKLSLSKEVEDAREAKAKASEVTNQERAWAGQIDQLNVEVEEERKKLRARRELKMQQKEAFQRQATKNAPECAFFEEKTGLKIRGNGRDVIHFKFVNIDRKSYARAFSFNVDVSQAAYSVTLDKPPNFLPENVLSSLVSRLNSDRDLWSFLRSMREAFKDEVELEYKYPNTNEVEKEHKRVELRALKERN